MKEVFELKEPFHSLHSQGNYFVRENVKTTHYCIQSSKHLAPEIWDIVPDQIKHCGILTKFKNFIKSWSTSDCPCRLYKIYIVQVDFICSDITISD